VYGNNPTPAKAKYTPSKSRPLTTPRVVPKPPTAPTTPRRVIDAKTALSTPIQKFSTPTKLETRTPNKVLSPVDPNKQPIQQTYTVLNKSAASPAPSNKKIKQLFGLSPLKENGAVHATPTKQVPSSATPHKRSLMKRILAAATPSSDRPRHISTRTTAKNITLTNFIEPLDCIKALEEALTPKGIECTRKG